MRDRPAPVAVLADLDGVLVDSQPAIDRVWRRWAALHGLDPEPLFGFMGGRPAAATIARFGPHLDLEREVQRILDWEIADVGGISALPGARELLAHPTLPVCVVTSCFTPLARARMDAAGLPLDGPVVTGDQVSRGKPDPEAYLLGAERLGVPIAACVVIEDAPAGIEAGLAAGATVVGLRTTHAEEDLARAHLRADSVASALEELGLG